MHNKTVFDNGLRVVTESIPHARTVSFGVWVDVGARDEHDLTNGCSHFVEHMLFKGTALRSASRIARELDSLGGMCNAFTSKDATCFYGSVLDTQLPDFVDLVADFFFNSLFDQLEIDRERQVILQEISMVEDTPEELVHDFFEGLLWGMNPLGNTVLGSMEVVSHMDRQKLLDHIRKFYTPDRIVLAAAGNVRHEELVDLVSSSFSFFSSPGPSVHERHIPLEIPAVQKLYTKKLEQVHLTLGTYGLAVTSEERYTLMLLNVLFGGNMSSRLFQEIRENRGLAYSVHSYVDSYSDCGYMGIYLGVNPDNLNASITVIRDQIRKISRNSISAEDLAGAINYGRAGLFLAAENMEARMTRLARNELYFGRNIPFDEVLQNLNKVTADAVSGMAGRLLDRGLTAAVLGPVHDGDVNWELIAGD